MRLDLRRLDGSKLSLTPAQLRKTTRDTNEGVVLNVLALKKALLAELGPVFEADSAIVNREIKKLTGGRFEGDSTAESKRIEKVVSPGSGDLYSWEVLPGDFQSVSRIILANADGTELHEKIVPFEGNEVVHLQVKRFFRYAGCCSYPHRRMSCSVALWQLCLIMMSSRLYLQCGLLCLIPANHFILSSRIMFTHVEDCSMGTTLNKNILI